MQTTKLRVELIVDLMRCGFVMNQSIHQRCDDDARFKEFSAMPVECRSIGSLS